MHVVVCQPKGMNTRGGMANKMYINACDGKKSYSRDGIPNVTYATICQNKRNGVSEKRCYAKEKV